MRKTDGSLTRNLDSDLLRTFLAIADAGSFTKGAQRIFRSQSAASLQIKQLEETLGQPVFDRHGRGVVLSPVGEKLERVARQVVGILESSLAELRADPLEGTIRIGLPDDYGHAILSRVIADFSRAHPRIEVIARCALSAGFPDALDKGELDVAVYEVDEVPAGAEVLREEQTYWVASRHHSAQHRTPLPIALFDRECWWRDAALDYLEKSGRAYRVVYSSESVAGVVAAIEAGVAVGMLGQSSLNDALVVLRAADGFGPVQTSKLVLDCRRGIDTPVTSAMIAAIRQAFASV